jgi:secondary thiamine-phosphate synthase enzyme
MQGLRGRDLKSQTQMSDKQGMTVETKSIRLSTRGFCDVQNVTDQIESALSSTGLSNGVVTVFVPGATAGVTTLEFEPGCVQDLKAAFERLSSEYSDYAHNARWGDGNGFSHIRAALLGASLQVPFAKKKLLVGTWQQVVVVDFDNRPRRREIILQFIGEL